MGSSAHLAAGHLPLYSSSQLQAVLPPAPRVPSTASSVMCGIVRLGAAEVDSTATLMDSAASLFAGRTWEGPSCRASSAGSPALLTPRSEASSASSCEPARPVEDQSHFELPGTHVIDPLTGMFGGLSRKQHDAEARKAERSQSEPPATWQQRLRVTAAGQRDVEQVLGRMVETAALQCAAELNPGLLEALEQHTAACFHAEATAQSENPKQRRALKAPHAKSAPGLVSASVTRHATPMSTPPTKPPQPAIARRPGDKWHQAAPPQARQTRAQVLQLRWKGISAQAKRLRDQVRAQERFQQTRNRQMSKEGQAEMEQRLLQEQQAVSTSEQHNADCAGDEIAEQSLPPTDSGDPPSGPLPLGSTGAQDAEELLRSFQGRSSLFASSSREQSGRASQLAPLPGAGGGRCASVGTEVAVCPVEMSLPLGSVPPAQRAGPSVRNIVEAAESCEPSSAPRIFSARQHSTPAGTSTGTFPSDVAVVLRTTSSRGSSWSDIAEVISQRMAAHEHAGQRVADPFNSPVSVSVDGPRILAGRCAGESSARQRRSKELVTVYRTRRSGRSSRSYDGANLHEVPSSSAPPSLRLVTGQRIAAKLPHSHPMEDHTGRRQTAATDDRAAISMPALPASRSVQEWATAADESSRASTPSSSAAGNVTPRRSGAEQRRRGRTTTPQEVAAPSQDCQEVAEQQRKDDQQAFCNRETSASLQWPSDDRHPDTATLRQGNDSTAAEQLQQRRRSFQEWGRAGPEVHGAGLANRPPLGSARLATAAQATGRFSGIDRRYTTTTGTTRARATSSSRQVGLAGGGRRGSGQTPGGADRPGFGFGSSAPRPAAATIDHRCSGAQGAAQAANGSAGRASSAGGPTSCGADYPYPQPDVYTLIGSRGSEANRSIQKKVMELLRLQAETVKDERTK
eukprot:jgi/Tetstr1/437495/TSEL_026174.t1